MKKTFPLMMFLALIFIAGCGDKGPDYDAIIETDFGSMKVKLYDETPKHKENFIKLAKEGFYDDLLFHRVISGFMIQGGDPDSKNAAPGARLGNGGPGYTIDHEIGFPHFNGTLAAARTGAGNPERKSSGSQFYIVHGKKDNIDIQLNRQETTFNFKYSDQQRQLYKEVGGAPALDMDYTVFGEVIEGFDVIDKIAATQTGSNDRPVQDVKMKVRLK